MSPQVISPLKKGSAEHLTGYRVLWYNDKRNFGTRIRAVGLMRKVDSGGGWPAIFYSFAKARQAGGWWKFYKALRSKNTCKTCALGMGGQQGGMVNERGSFPEVCKKSMQAMASDMQPAITADFWSRHSISDLQGWSPRQLEYAGRLIQPVLWERGARHFKTITWNESF